MFASDFAIESMLSEGGMGRVYVARQLSTGKRRALKLMLPGLVADATLRSRFVQEARIGASIESDYIVEVVAAGIDARTGLPWLAMELLEGELLADLCDHYGALAPEECHSILRQLCHGLAAAHRVGIVHRDLKPENIFLAKARRLDVAYTVKILDFGIAKIAAEAKTHATAAIGSPLWMAPEQTIPGGAITPATDVWALGLIAFQLLSGRQYWLSTASPSASPIQVIREVAFEPLVAASRRLAQLGANDLLPSGFDGWFSRCVTRDAGARFSTAAEAHDALVPLLHPAPAATSAPPAAPFAARARSAQTVASAPLPFGPEPGPEGDERDLVRTTRALAFVSRIGDERARAFQRFALMKILEEVDQGHRPSRPFDLAYFCEVLEIIFRDRDTLLTLLAGDVAALDWLPEC